MHLVKRPRGSAFLVGTAMLLLCTFGWIKPAVSQSSPGSPDVTQYSSQSVSQWD